MSKLDMRIRSVEKQDHSWWAASAAVVAQERLLSDICAAQSVSGNPIEVISERLGISPDEVRDALSGQTDLTLTELRYLSTACDVVIRYTVYPAAQVHKIFISTFNISSSTDEDFRDARDSFEATDVDSMILTMQGKR